MTEDRGEILATQLKDALLKPPRRRRRKYSDPTLDALERFARALEADPDPNSVRAALFWLCDKYLGIKLWGQQ